GAPSGGTGLGLAIARWVVERHGGRIGVRNGETVGAIFRAELPAGSGEAAAAQGAPTPAAPAYPHDDVPG
ncbi:MAG TPA: ATP-binding protein, partial [Candidatus Limnocylindrales bacterium]|nr:ATP-binding protein [Candidatus Limnocylindrales bacterium]